MRRAIIIDEFLDYRSYVSHTLCKHRLLLGLDAPDSATRRLRDGAVWPLVHNEAIALLDHARTLYGLGGAALDEQEPVIRTSAAALTDLVAGFLRGESARFNELHAEARRFNDALTMLGIKLEKHSPDFHPDSVLKYFGADTNYTHWLDQARLIVRSEISPLIKQMVNDSSNALGAYQAFWPHATMALFRSREARVAGAVADVPKEALNPIATFRQGLRDLERMVSCWSPVLEPDARQRELHNAMRAQGFRTLQDIQQIVRRLEG